MTERCIGQFHRRMRIALINTANQIHVIEAHHIRRTYSPVYTLCRYIDTLCTYVIKSYSKCPVVSGETFLL